MEKAGWLALQPGLGACVCGGGEGENRPGWYKINNV